MLTLGRYPSAPADEPGSPTSECARQLFRLCLPPLHAPHRDDAVAPYCAAPGFYADDQLANAGYAWTLRVRDLRPNARGRVTRIKRHWLARTLEYVLLRLDDGRTLGAWPWMLAKGYRLKRGDRVVVTLDRTASEVAFVRRA